MSNTYAVAVDGRGNIYAGNYAPSAGSVTVYPAGSNGNVAPAATISGASTGLAGPVALAVDASGNLYVYNYDNDSITIYAAGSNGNIAPLAARPRVWITPKESRRTPGVTST